MRIDLDTEEARTILRILNDSGEGFLASRIEREVIKEESRKKVAKSRHERASYPSFSSKNGETPKLSNNKAKE